MSSADEAPEKNLTSFHVGGAIKGDASSLEWVIAHFDPLVEAQIRMRVKGKMTNPEDVRDILSEVWLVTLGKMAELDPRDGRYTPVLMRFLATTAERKCMEYVRGQGRRRAVEGQPAHAAADSGLPGMDHLPLHTRGVVTRIHHNEVRSILGRCLDRLPENQREVLILRLLEQRSNSEIAALLQVQPNTIAVRYRRALAELARILPSSIFEGLSSIREACKENKRQHGSGET